MNLHLLILLFSINCSVLFAANSCKCECCSTDNCQPRFMGLHQLLYCSETTTCKRENCIDWHGSQCPLIGNPGQTRAVCVSQARTFYSLEYFSILINLIWPFLFKQ